MLHAHDRKALDAAVVQLGEALGERLTAVSLRGEAAGEDYRARRSPLDLVVVVDRVDGELLARLRPLVPAWARRRIGPPLILDRAYIETSLDTFPLEFLDLRERRVHLAGATDPFRDMVINREHLRLEVEEQLRGKLLHLWAAYMVPSRTKRSLRELLFSISRAYEPLCRALLYLAERPRPSAFADVLCAVEECFEVALPSLRLLDAAHRGEARIKGGAAEDAFDGCLIEARKLVSTVDAL
jgi:hypothetical protein